MGIPEALQTLRQRPQKAGAAGDMLAIWPLFSRPLIAPDNRQKEWRTRKTGGKAQRDLEYSGQKRRTG
ncbi:MAG TPA: hypothetical protein DHV46_05135 [Desulfovibrio piger]|uniref:Uncharacterized protein n=1 Tax=Desulfovibrio piger ATCC 29098 TaxID=411464 RepID=B6WRI4_9BACT|nr:hypothetical protein DESPIG_00675 [Desulfovibrio piger ATCC 29098]HCZ43917.1 hypothetical protein [Desulfovibrio piger]